MVNKRAVEQLMGETIREIGLLLLVFGPLDALFQPDRPSAGVLAALIAGALLFIILGIIIEAGREHGP